MHHIFLLHISNSAYINNMFLNVKTVIVFYIDLFKTNQTKSVYYNQGHTDKVGWSVIAEAPGPKEVQGAFEL